MLRLHKSRFEEMERMRKRSNVLKFTEGVIIGTALGVVAGILLAPDRGEDTRNRILDEMFYFADRTKSFIPGCCREEDFEGDISQQPLKYQTCW